MALILVDQAAKDPAAAAGPVTRSSSSSQDTLESTDKKKKVGDSRLAESKEQETTEAVNTLLSISRLGGEQRLIVLNNYVWNCCSSGLCSPLTALL